MLSTDASVNKLSKLTHQVDLQHLGTLFQRITCLFCGLSGVEKEKDYMPLA